jgi:hypothetical protein
MYICTYLGNCFVHAAHAPEVPPQVPPPYFGRRKSSSKLATFSPLPSKGGRNVFAPLPYNPPLKPGEKRNIYALPRQHASHMCRGLDTPLTGPPSSVKSLAAAHSPAKSLKSALAPSSALSTARANSPTNNATKSPYGSTGGSSLLHVHSPMRVPFSAFGGSFNDLTDLIPQPHKWRPDASASLDASDSQLFQASARSQSAGPFTREDMAQGITRQTVAKKAPSKSGGKLPARPHSALGLARTGSSRGGGGGGGSVGGGKGAAGALRRVRGDSTLRYDSLDSVGPSTGYRRLRSVG